MRRMHRHICIERKAVYTDAMVLLMKNTILRVGATLEYNFIEISVFEMCFPFIVNTNC